MESMEFFNVATLNQLDSMSLSLEILNSSDYEQSVLDINSHFIWPLKLIISYTLYVIDNYNKFEFLNIFIGIISSSNTGFSIRVFLFKS